MATWAKGIDFKNSNNTSRIGGIGIYGTDSTINKLYIGLGVEPWNNAGLQLTSSAINFKGNKIYHAGDKPTASEIGAAASSHTHNYMPHTKYTTTQDANNIKTTGVYSFNATCTNAATSNHGTLIAEFNVGTPYQLWMPDNANIIYKRNYTTSSDTWGSWNNTLANNISGNASTATTLQTARTLTIGNTGKSFNGSGNISWSLSEIGAAASSHSHNSLTTKGTNTINSTANDTVSNWGAHGHSVHWYTQSGCLNEQPSQYGYILNLGSGTEVHQLWMTQASGNLAHRGGNGYGWNGSWKTILDSSNFTSYAASANHSHSNYAASSHTHNMISMKSGHVSDWTSSSAMNGKTYMGGWHGNLTSGTAGYISLGANGSSTLDLFIDGEVYVKENQKVYHPGNKPTAADIGAAASNHTHSYLPLSGGTMTGTLALKPGGSTLTGTGIATGNTQLIGTGTDTIYFGNPKTKIILESNSTPSVSVNGTTYTMYHTGNKPTASEIGAAASSHSHSYLPLSGGTITGALTSSVTTGTHLAGNKGTAIINSTATGSSYNMLAKMNSTNGVWTMGSWGTSFCVFYTANSIINAGTNSYTKRLTLLDESGNSSFPGTVTASGSLNSETINATSTIATNGGINAKGTITGYAIKATNGMSVAGSEICANKTSAGSYFNRVPIVGSDGAIEVGRYMDWHYSGTENKDYHLRLEVPDWACLFVNGGLRVTSTFYPNSNGGIDVGQSGTRFRTVYCTTVNQSSDKKYKEDIVYLDDVPTTISDRSTNTNIFKKFIADDLKIASYKFVQPEVKAINNDDENYPFDQGPKPWDNQIGFIAQDVYETEVGKHFVYEENGDYSFSPSGFTTVVAKALQEEIKSRDIIIQNMQSQIDELNEKINLLMTKL